jgi:hypothetical protein
MKTTKTYSIEGSIYNAFDSLTTEKNINKSSFIEDCIKKFLKDNDMDFVDKLYCLKTNPDHIVTVISQDSTYYILDDGSKIQRILFMQIFKELSPINPDEFFSKSNPILENIAEEIKNIKISDYIVNDEQFYKDKTKIQNINLLNEINNNYNSSKYLTADIKEIYYDLIYLQNLIFDTNEKEYDLQQLLIKNLTEYKNDWININTPGMK